MAFPVGWNRKCALVIQHVKVPSDQTAFPVLITNDTGCLPAEMVTSGGANAAQSNGGDIRFSSDSAGLSQLACEIVVWTQNATASNAKAEVWVLVNVLSASDVTVYVWYSAGGGLSQPAANAAFGAQAVWGTYTAVYHMGDGTTLSLNDSTSHAYTLSNIASVLASAGKIGGGANSPTGGRYFFRAGGVPSQLVSTTKFSVSLWVNMTTYATAGGAMFSINWNSTNDILFAATTANQIIVQVDNGVDGGGSYSEDIRGSWHHMVMTYDGTQTGNANRLKVYSQSVQQTMSYGAYTVPATTSNQSGADLAINFYVSPATWSPIAINDEVQIAVGALTQDWITTEYNNQNSPSTFVVAGAAGPAGGGAQPQPFVIA